MILLILIRISNCYYIYIYIHIHTYSIYIYIYIKTFNTQSDTMANYSFYLFLACKIQLIFINNIVTINLDSIYKYRFS